MVLPRILLVLLLAAPVAAQSPSEAALAAAKAAIRAQNYPQALAILEAPDLAQTPELLLMRASLYQAGRGVARDDRKAFRLTRSAAAMGSIEAQYNLGRLLLSGRGVTADPEAGRRWITKAAEGGHIRAAALLVNLLQSAASPAPAPRPAQTIAIAPVRGSDISRRMGWTPLMEAVQRARPEVLESLLPEADLNAQDAEGRTALMLAVSADNISAVDMLLRAGADPEATDKSGTTALGYAAHTGNNLVVRMLLSAGVWPDIPNVRGQTPLDEAIASQHSDTAVLMLGKRGLTLSDDLMRQLWFLAAENGTQALLEALIAHGATCDMQDVQQRTALDLAAETGNLVLLRFCLPAATPPLLVRATRAGQVAFAMELLAAGIDANAASESGNTALLIAAHKGYALLVEALLNRHADPDHRNHAGNTALMLAAENGHREIVTRLLAAGANTGLRNKQREQAQDIARAAGYPELAALLE